MFYGIFSHGATIANPVIHRYPGLAFIQDFSDLFRNAAFFLVSGFFTALVWSRSDWRRYLRNRVEVLAIPLVASLLTIAPITNWLIHSWHNGWMSLPAYLGGGWRNPTVGNDTWALHLWFLMALLCYAALTPALVAGARSRPFTRLVEAYLACTGRWAPYANVGLYALLVVASLAVHDQLVRPLVAGTRLAWVARACFTFLPVFALGVVAFIHRRFLDTLAVVSPTGLLLFLAAYLLHPVIAADLPRPVERSFYWLARAGLSLFIISALIGLARRYFDRPSPRLTLAVESAYSFYLFHFTWIYVLAFLLRPLLHDLRLIYVGVVALGLPLTLLWHVLVIDRFDLLRRLYTGRRRRRGVPGVAPARGS